MREEIWYECDPDRNPECTKMTCYRREIGKRFGFVGNPCRTTLKREAARLDEHGEPVRIGDTRAYLLGQKLGAMDMDRTKAGLQRISALLGHEKIDTTMKYVILNDNDLRNSYRKYA